jgi:hypothetical protein
VLGGLVLGGAVARLGERGGAGDDVQQPADVRHRLLLRRVVLFHDGERAGLERRDFHAVVQPLPARHMGE